MTPFVREAGSGPAVICLHSNASTSGQWRGLMELLAPDFRVLAPDLLGAGRSAAWPVEAGARMQHELDALAPLIDGAGDRLHLVGHSYGRGAGASHRAVLARARGVGGALRAHAVRAC